MARMKHEISFLIAIIINMKKVELLKGKIFYRFISGSLLNWRTSYKILDRFNLVTLLLRHKVQNWRIC